MGFGVPYLELNRSKSDYAVRPLGGARKPSQAEHPERDALVNSDDVLVLADYLFSFPVAWTLPERWWPALAKAISIALTPLSFRDFRETEQSIGSILGARCPASLLETLPRRQHIMSLIQAMQHLRCYRPGGWVPPIELNGSEHIDNALKAGTGAVLWVSDFIFSTLVTKMALSRFGYRVTHLSRPTHPLSRTRIGRRVLNPIVTRLETRYLEQRTVVDDGQMIGGLRVMIRKLKSNGLISVTLDNQSKQVVQAPILDGYIHVAKGAPRLAVSAGSALLPVFTLPCDDGGFNTTIGAPLEFDREGAVDEACVHAIRRLVERLEPLLIDKPHLWYDWSELITSKPTL